VTAGLVTALGIAAEERGAAFNRRIAAEGVVKGKYLNSHIIPCSSAFSLYRGDHLWRTRRKRGVW
jgi:hypothetical protein